MVMLPRLYWIELSVDIYRIIVELIIDVVFFVLLNQLWIESSPQHSDIADPSSELNNEDDSDGHDESAPLIPRI